MSQHPEAVSDTTWAEITQQRYVDSQANLAAAEAQHARAKTIAGKLLGKLQIWGWSFESHAAYRDAEVARTENGSSKYDPTALVGDMSSRIL